MKNKLTIARALIIFLLVSSCVSQKKSVQNSRQIQNTQSSSAVAAIDQEFIIEEDNLIDESEYEEVLKVSPNPRSNYYQVQKNDTLMLVSYKLYGDYRRWKELYKINKEIIPSDFDLSNVDALYFKDASQLLFQPKGKPYLIKKGDSLSLISDKVYGNWKQWKKIWKNNETQIKGPNLIFAGFTLFYPPKDERSTLAKINLY